MINIIYKLMYIYLLFQIANPPKESVILLSHNVPSLVQGSVGVLNLISIIFTDNNIGD